MSETSQLAATFPAVEISQAGFSAVQKQYLQGFFAGAMQRMPFAGHTADGSITNDPASGACSM